ncbi:hypothetical protein KCP69_04650 [Salmonella enterica subsp. enterica]|nr:hypothetical protein KCP69_04650 [Salmonella enterica subsp. enterica]
MPGWAEIAFRISPLREARRYQGEMVTPAKGELSGWCGALMMDMEKVAAAAQSTALKPGTVTPRLALLPVRGTSE